MTLSLPVQPMVKLLVSAVFEKTLYLRLNLFLMVRAFSGTVRAISPENEKKLPI